MSETTSQPDRHLTWIFKSEKSLGILFILINAKVIRSLELLKSRKVSKTARKLSFSPKMSKNSMMLNFDFSTLPFLNHFNVKLQSVNFDYFKCNKCSLNVKFWAFISSETYQLHLIFLMVAQFIHLQSNARWNNFEGFQKFFPRDCSKIKWWKCVFMIHEISSACSWDNTYAPICPRKFWYVFVTSAFLIIVSSSPTQAKFSFWINAWKSAVILNLSMNNGKIPETT